MTLTAPYSNLTLKAFAKALEVNLPIKEVFGKLGKNQFETNIKVGDEVDFIMPPEVTVTDLTDNSDLSHQELNNNTIKIKCDKQKYYDYAIKDPQIALVNAMPEKEATIFLTEAVKNATEKFITYAELDRAALYSKAGFNFNASSVYNPSGYSTPTNAYALTDNTIRQFFHDAAAMMGDGQTIDGVPRSSWKDDKMLMYVPYKVESLLVGTGDFKYTQKGIENAIKGEIGTYAGWRIIRTNLIQPDNSGNYHLLFGIEGEALGTIMNKNLTSEKLRSQTFFGDIFRGMGIYGVGVVRRDKLGTAYVSAAHS